MIRNKPIIGVLLFVGVIMSSCGKDPEPTGPVRFSVLGDSFSTYEGYVDPATNDVWEYYQDIGLTEVKQMWWYQMSQTMGWELEKNNSFSGSLVCNMDYGNYYGKHSFLRRMDDLGNPDVIFVFGGTNDIWDEAPMSEYVFRDWTENDLCSFRPALACLFDGLQRYYPEAELYYLADDALGEAFMESVHVISSHFGVSCIDLHGVKKDWQHPNVEGMTNIADQVVDALLREHS